MMKIKTLSLVLILCLSVFTFCKKQHDNEPEEEETSSINNTSNLLKIGEMYIIGANAKVLIFAPRNLETGYNSLYIQFIDSATGNALNYGHCKIFAKMNMGGTIHYAPIENSTDSVVTDNYYKRAVVFPMTGTASQWQLLINYHNHTNNTTGNGTLNIQVNASTPSRFKDLVLALDSNKQVYMSLVQPELPKVGKNNFEIVLHQKITDSIYTTINSYSVEIEPEMASMEHGSPFNVNPIFTEKGHYFGRVNFTMTGAWIVHVRLFKNGTLISTDQIFDMDVH